MQSWRSLEKRVEKRQQHQISATFEELPRKRGKIKFELDCRLVNWGPIGWFGQVVVATKSSTDVCNLRWSHTNQVKLGSSVMNSCGNK